MRRLIVEIENPPMVVEFHPILRICTVRYGDAVYEDLEVKRRWMEKEYLYEIIVPTIPKPYMLAIGKDAIYGYEHPERQELIITIKEPEAKKKRKKDSGQRGLWE